jgi:hypothetical protein
MITHGLRKAAVIRRSGRSVTLKIGSYRHYKGNTYIVLGIAKHSETLEQMVVYQQDYGERGLWVRPQDMFLETVDVDGQRTPRFQFMGEDDA